MVKESLVIIPTYNEKENIENILTYVFEKYDDVHILVVDDNSPDGTANIVKTLQKKFKSRLFLEQRTGKLGLGTAYIHGFKWGLSSGYKYLIEMDADFSHDPDALIRLYNSCALDGNDVSIGSRYKNGVNVVNWPMGRVLMSFFASKYVQIVTGLPINDTTAGYVCYKREVLETLDLDRIKFIGYAFQIEMKFKSWRLGFKISEVPIIFRDRTKGQSKMSTKIFKEAFLGVLELKIKSLFQHPAELQVQENEPS